MLGAICLGTEYGRTVKAERTRLCGMRVCCAGVNDRGILGHRRVRKAAELLHRAGVDRVLTQENFPYWEELEKIGIRPVDPIPFLQSCAAEIMCAALKRRRRVPSECTVSLRGQHGGRVMRTAAMELCPAVRDLCISAERGGEEISSELRWTFGAAVRPDFSKADGVVRFHWNTAPEGDIVLNLFGKNPDLCGVEIDLEGVTVPHELERLPFLSALWMCGLVQKEQFKIT